MSKYVCVRFDPFIGWEDLESHILLSTARYWTNLSQVLRTETQKAEGVRYAVVQKQGDEVKFIYKAK